MAEITDAPPAESAPGEPLAVQPPAHSTDTYEQSASTFLSAMQTPDSGDQSTQDGPGPKPKPKANQDSFLKQLFTTGIFGGIGHIAAHPFHAIGQAASGVMTAATETAKAVATVAGAPLAGWDASKKSAAGIVAPVENLRDALFGPKSKDSTDSFVSGTAQFVAGMLGANEIRLGSFAIKQLPNVIRGGVSAGISSGLSFDPHEQQWSEWAASSNIPVIQQLGNLSAPTANNGELVSRAKRAMGGLIPGIAVDGLMATYGLLRANTVLKSTTATAAEKQVAVGMMKVHADVLKSIEDRTYVPSTPAIVEPAPAGGFHIVPNEPVIAAQRAEVQAAGLAQPAPEAAQAAPAATPKFAEVTPEQFHAAVADFSAARPDETGFLTHRTPEEMKADGMRTFLSPDGKTGFAIAPDGDIRNVFNHGEKGKGFDAVAHAIQQGGSKLDNFDTGLTNVYKDLGFQEKPGSRQPWNPDYAPAQWNATKHGTPDYIEMTWAGDPALKSDPQALVARAQEARAARKGQIPVTSTVSEETANAAADGKLARAVLDDNGKVHVAPVEAQNLSHAEIMADAQRTKNAPFDNFTPAERGWIDEKGNFVSAKDVGEVLSPSTPKFEQQYQAEAQAATINDALATRFQANTVISDEQMNAVRGLATQIEQSGGDAAKIAELIDTENPHFNFTYLDTPEKTNAVLKSLGEILSPAFEKARAAGGIAWEVSMERARQLAGMIPREDLNDFIRTNANVIKNADAFVFLLDSQMNDLTAQASKAAAILEQRPLDLVAQDEARQAVQALIDTAAEAAGTNSGLGRGLAALKGRGKLTDLKFMGEPGAVETAATGAAKEGNPGVVANMSPEELRDFMQLFRLSDNPSVLLDTATKVLKPIKGAPGKLVGGFFQVFYNTLLSNPATWGAIYTGIGAVSLYEDGIRALAGVASRNPLLVQEAADIIASRAIYLKQSVEGMGAALKAGKSVIDPVPVRHAIPTMQDVGITSWKDAAANPGKAAGAVPGEFINSLGSRPIATMEEFWRVNNTLAKTRADALALVRRDAKAQGLEGPALDSYINERVNAIVKASIDPETGASRLPASRQFARYRSLMSPLDEGTFGKKLEAMAQDHPLVRAVMPFVRVTFNSADMAFLKNSPLGIFTKDYREAMNAGGSEAALMQTRLAVGTTLWSGAGILAFQGVCTGGGPSNSKLRQAWVDAGNQPYSCKIGGKQISYRRFEPFSTLLSLTSDVASILRDHGDDPAIAEGGAKVFYAVLAATADAFANKTYLSSLTKFMDAATSGQGSKMKAFFDQYIAAGVPGELAAFNSDPYVRQTQGMFDAFVNRVPGWSKSLPALYNAFGEPRLSTPGRTQKALNPYPIKDGPSEFASAESEQLDLGRTLAVPPTVEKTGKLSVNLHDPKYQAKDGGTDTPYERWMGYIQDADLRGKVDKLINSPQYEKAGTGTDALVGGRRYDLLNTLVDRVQKEAKLKMLNQYPELKNDLTALQRAARVSKYSDTRGQSILDRIR